MAGEKKRSSIAITSHADPRTWQHCYSCSASSSTMATSLPPGLFPVMLTPFNEDKSVDFEGLKALTNWYIDSGASGLFTVAQSSEMHSMTPAERLAVAKCVLEAAGGRVPVVASGTFPPLGAKGAGIEEQAASVRDMAATGVAAVVVLACCMAQEGEEEEVFKANVAALMERTPGVVLGQYECPVPYHRKCSAETLSWIAKSGRFSFHKDTSRFYPLITDKMAAIRSAELPASNPFRFYNGNVTTLSHSLAEGGAGCGVVCANFYPHIVAWICRRYHDADTALVAKVQRFLSVADTTVKDHYPASAKTYCSEQLGLPIGNGAREGKAFPPAGGAPGDEMRLRHAALKVMADELSAELVTEDARLDAQKGELAAAFGALSGDFAAEHYQDMAKAAAFGALAGKPAVEHYEQNAKAAAFGALAGKPADKHYEGKVKGAAFEALKPSKGADPVD